MYLRHFVREETAEPRYSSCLPLLRLSFFSPILFPSLHFFLPLYFLNFYTFFCFFLTQFLFVSIFPSIPSFPFQITSVFLSYILWLVVSNFPPPFFISSSLSFCLCLFFLQFLPFPFKLLQFLFLTFFDCLSLIFLLTVFTFHYYFLYSITYVYTFFDLPFLPHFTFCLSTYFCSIWNRIFCPQ